ncbi:MFS transporter [Mycetocola saprophilus]|uniref:MFS transporter n=1 Tax=Mycetocola saprophilus TaxID=76636 RepID=UPI000689B289|nr:MFS transporter [Mycetocola saprophilus]
MVAVFVLSNAPTPLYVLWQNAWGFSSGTLTVVFAAYMVGLIGVLSVGGRIADRFGRRVVLLPGIAAAILASVLFLYAPNIVWLLVARLFAGVAVGAAVSAGMAAVVDLAPATRKHSGSLIASTSMVFGSALGPLLSGGITRITTDYQRWVFTVVLVLTTAALILVFFLPARHTPAPRDGPANRRWSWPAPPANRRRELMWGVAAFAPGITATSFVLSLGPSTLAHIDGSSSPLLSGAVACVMFLTATGVQFALSRMSSRSHLALSSLCAIAAMVCLALSVTLVNSSALFLIAAILAGSAQGTGQLGGLTLIATRIPSARRAESNSVLNISGYIPAAILPVSTGYLVDGIGLPGAVLCFAVVLGVSAAISLITTRITMPVSFATEG